MHNINETMMDQTVDQSAMIDYEVEDDSIVLDS